MNDCDKHEAFEARFRSGVPIVRAVACRVWSEMRCGCELEELVDAGSRVLVLAAEQAASDAEFLDKLLGGLGPALVSAASHDEGRAP
jgi:hypothetical protein